MLGLKLDRSALTGSCHFYFHITAKNKKQKQKTKTKTKTPHTVEAQKLGRRRTPYMCNPKYALLKPWMALSFLRP